MNRLTSDLETIADKIRSEFSAKDAAREKALRLCRESIRYSSNAIRAVHRQEYAQAEAQLASVRSFLDEANQALADYGDLLHGGFVHNAEKEFVEGRATLALIIGKALPGPDELGVGYAAYLNGLGEAVGELRRYLLDSMRGGNLPRGEELLSAMDDIYGILVTMDFPDAMTIGLRRTTDVVRGILEKTRGDLTLALGQRELQRQIESLEKKSL